MEKYKRQMANTKLIVIIASVLVALTVAGIIAFGCDSNQKGATLPVKSSNEKAVQSPEHPKVGEDGQTEAKNLPSLVKEQEPSPDLDLKLEKQPPATEILAQAAGKTGGNNFVTRRIIV